MINIPKIKQRIELFRRTVGGIIPVPTPSDVYIIIDNQEEILLTNQDEWIISE